MQRRLQIILAIVAVSIPTLSAYSAATPFTIDGSTVYVNAGFVGVRTSTPITVLDVNGDAQFGSGATKSTFTATGLLKLTSSGINWADGSTSTTATSGGGADNAVGFAHEFGAASTAAFTSVASYTFGSSAFWASSTTYICRFEITCNTANTFPYMRVSGDSGSNYRWGSFNIRRLGTGLESNSDYATGFALANVVNGGWTANSFASGEVRFSTQYGSAKLIQASWRTVTNIAGEGGLYDGAGTYIGANSFSPPTFGVNSGTMTGMIRCKHEDPYPNY